jgi:uncharacterized protein YbjT (DUF2867 family)
MHIVLAGGTGVVGSRLLPALLAAGHTVTATTRRPARLPRLETLGAEGVVVDVTDADGFRNAALRRVGTANIVDAMRHAGREGEGRGLGAPPHHG